MSQIPLFLKIKSSSAALGSVVDSSSEVGEESTKVFTQLSDKAIQFNNENYDFERIFTAEFSPNEFSKYVDNDENQSSCYIFMGPTSSGKTTTIKSLVFDKIKQIEPKDPVSVTAFEVSDNKFYSDLLQNDKTKTKKSFLSSVPIESQLRKERLLKPKLAESLLHKVFNRRVTQKTSFNNESSRSCLVLTFYSRNNTKRVTYIDLMGNEKFDKAVPSANIFANMNMSSITQLLTNSPNNPALIRSSNRITNLIFRNQKQRGTIKIILTLDQYGDYNLTKSTLNNVAHLIKRAKIDNTQSSDENVLMNAPNLTLPNYARPTASSSPISSPPKLSSIQGIVPNQLKNKRILCTDGSPMLMFTSTPADDLPSKNDSIALDPIIKPTSGVSPISKKSHIKTPTRFKVPHNKSSAVANKLTANFYEVQIQNLKSTVQELELKNQQLQDDHRKVIEVLTREKLDLNNDLINFKKDHELEVNSIKEKLNESDIIITNNKILLQQKDQLNEKVNQFQIDLSNYRIGHNNLNQTILNLKLSIEALNDKNKGIIDSKSDLETELESLKAKLDEVEMNNSVFKAEYQRIEAENESFKKQIEFLKETNDSNLKEIKEELAQQFQLLREKDESIQQLTSENESYVKVINENNSTIDSQKDMINSLTEENTSLSEQVDHHKSENDILTREFNELKLTSSRKSTELMSLIDEKDILLESKDGVIESKDKLILEKSTEFEEHKVECSSMISSLNDEIAIKTEDLNTTNEKLVLVESELDTLNSSYQEVLATSEELKSENKTIVDKYNDSLKENEEVRNENKLINSKYKNSIKEISSLKKDMKGNVAQVTEKFNKLLSPDKPISLSSPLLNPFLDPSPGSRFDATKDIFSDKIEKPHFNKRMNSSTNSSPLKNSNTPNYKGLVQNLMAEKTLKRKASNNRSKDKLAKHSPTK